MNNIQKYFILAGIVLTTFIPGFAAAESQSYTTPGAYSFTAPQGVSSVQVSVVGAGGGGGGGFMSGDYWGGGGGGSGGYMNRTISVTPGQIYTVAVGAGGCGGHYWYFGSDMGGGCPYTTYSGASGGDSSFGTSIATGGQGGPSGLNNYVDGGVGPMGAGGSPDGVAGTPGVGLPNYGYCGSSPGGDTGQGGRGGDGQGCYTAAQTGQNGSVVLTWTVPTVPDFTAGITTLTPAAPVADQSVSLSSTISNSSIGSSATQFSNVIQVGQQSVRRSRFFGSTIATTVLATLPTETISLAAGSSAPVSASYTFPTNGAYVVRTCADMDEFSQGTVTESDEGNNCGSWTTVTVTAPLLPDLTASAITPTSATVGPVVTLSSTISNIGTGATGASFRNLFQRATDALGTDAAFVSVSLSSSLAAGNSTPTTLPYVFNTAGTYYFRACADKESSGDTGVITESNENNNCGAWSPIIVSWAACTNGTNNPPTCTTFDPCGNSAVNPPNCSVFAPTATLSASPTTIDQGQSSSLTWGSTNATACVGTGFTAGGPSGTRSTGTLSTAGIVTYQIVCSGTGGSSPPAFASVEVLSPDATISASPARVRSGVHSQISWDASGVNSCVISGPGLSRPNYPGQQSVAISAQSTFTITCQTNSTPITRSVTVNLLTDFEEF